MNLRRTPAPQARRDAAFLWFWLGAAAGSRFVPAHPGGDYVVHLAITAVACEFRARLPACCECAWGGRSMAAAIRMYRHVGGGGLLRVAGFLPALAIRAGAPWVGGDARTPVSPPTPVFHCSIGGRKRWKALRRIENGWRPIGAPWLPPSSSETLPSEGGAERARLAPRITPLASGDDATSLLFLFCKNHRPPAKAPTPPDCDSGNMGVPSRPMPDVVCRVRRRGPDGKYREWPIGSAPFKAVAGRETSCPPGPHRPPGGAAPADAGGPGWRRLGPR